MTRIIVPTDFTPTSTTAAEYAVQLARHLTGEVQLMHIAKDESQAPAAKSRIAEQCNQVKTPGIEVQGTVRIGNFLHDIPAAAKEEKAGIIVMGTHGLKGLQYLIGSQALRMVSESVTPYIIVQDGTTRTADIKKILVPIDLHKETKQKLTFCAQIAQRFNSEIHIICPKETDEYLRNQLMRNVAYAEGYFEEQKLTYKSTVATSPSSGFVKDVIRYAASEEIDLICVLNFASENLLHVFGSDDEQKLITNEEKIPVFILNPIATMVDSKSVFAQ